MVAVILILGAFFVGLCVAALVRFATLRRLRTVERLDAIQEYGFASDSAAAGLPSRPASTGLSAYVSKLGEFVGQRFGGVREDDLRAELMAAGVYSMTPRTLLGYRVLAAILLPVLVLFAGSGSALAFLLAVVMVGAGWMLPLILVRRKARIRLRQIDRALPDMIDLLVVTIEAGLGFSGALRVASENMMGPLADELRLTLQEQTMGLSVEEALSHLALRADTPNTRAFVRAMAQGERLGISVGQIMRNLGLEMRKRRRIEAEEKAHKAPVKMLFPLVFLIFPSMFIVLLVPALIAFVHSISS
jgi:tight adherence protein C